MKHIFIINPVAGTGKGRAFFMPRILKELRSQNLSYKVHITTKQGDAKRFVEKIISFRKDEKQTLRFYACGGDGTLSEVLNGIGLSKNVQLACIPAGTGNDFIRNFGDEKMFRNIRGQLAGEVYRIDILQCMMDGQRKAYGINLVNMGLDCEATKNMEAVKKNPFLKGSAGYIYGAAKAFVQLASFPYRVHADGKKFFEGDLTLLAVGNGIAYGGGFKATPRARVDDAILDICLVERINRRQFAKLVGAYRKGEHLVKDKDNVIHYQQAQRIQIESDRGIEASIDGELIKAERLDISVLPRAVEFVIPKQDTSSY